MLCLTFCQLLTPYQYVVNTNIGFTGTIAMYIVSLLQFHLSADAITKCANTKMENLVTCYLKKWLGLPRNATHIILPQYLIGFTKSKVESLILIVMYQCSWRSPCSSSS